MREAEFAQQFTCRALVFRNGQKKVFNRNVFVFQTFRLALCRVEQLGEAVRDVDLVGTGGRTGDFGKLFDFGQKALVQSL